MLFSKWRGSHNGRSQTQRLICETESFSFRLLRTLGLISLQLLSSIWTLGSDTEAQPLLEAPSQSRLSVVEANHYPESGLTILYELRSDHPGGSLGILYEFDRAGIAPSEANPSRAFRFSKEGSGSLAVPVRALPGSGFFTLMHMPDSLPKTMMWISAGLFEMGSPEDEPGRYPDEGPLRKVEIPSDFFLSKYEVTQSEFQLVMGTNPSASYHEPNLPVERVSWLEAVEYCARVTRRERDLGKLPPGYAYRLPTEAEWEFACRAGSTKAYGFGDDATLLGDHAWYGDNGGPTPHPVGLKRPNAWGLFDMHGNVFEWCLDEYRPYPGGKSTRPEGSTVVYRPSRGGAFYCPPEICRSACRFESAPQSSRSSLRGFRVAIGREMPSR